MPEYTKKIVYLSNAQYQELITNKTITVNNTSIDHDKNTLYITPQNTPLYEQDLATVAITGDYEDLSNKPEIPVQDVQVNGTSVLSNGVANVPIGHTQRYGAMKAATAAEAQAGAAATCAVSPYGQHVSTFYGLSKVAGVDLANETVTLGTYPNSAKTAICTMIGATASGDGSAAPVQDVQINGTSILSNKIVNIPVATASSIGAVRCGNGLYMGNNGGIHANFCGSDQIKTNASILSTAIPPASLYKDMVFYGLARVAGDTTQSASSNSIGTYTNEAKQAIQQMLGLDTTTVNVTGTAPTITAQSNHRYICGEVTSINFTPSASGLCELMFTSGSTVAVLTLPSTVKMPEWFEVETERIYDIIITDGVYGAVTSWAM